MTHPTVHLQDGPDYPFFADFRARAAEAGNREVPLILLDPTES